MKTLTLKNSKQFRDLISDNNIELSWIVVETIKNNIDAKKGPIHVARIEILSESLELDLTVEPEEYVSVLEKNLEKFEMHEEYETCANIKNLIKYLTLKE